MSISSFAGGLSFNRVDTQLNIAAGYAVNLTTYTILRQTTGMSQVKCAVISTTGTIFLGVMKEVLISHPFSLGGVGAVTIGGAGAVIVPIVFNF